MSVPIQIMIKHTRKLRQIGRLRSHIAFILLKKGRISMDPKYINVGCKTKPGSKKKAKKWFFHQLGNFDFK